jgi:hypothetical protein
MPPVKVEAEREEASSCARLEWTCHPARRQPGKAVAAGVFSLACAVAAAVWTGVVFWGIFFFVVLAVSIAPFYLPTRFVLDDKGVEKVYLGVPQRRSWSQFQSWYRDRNGVLLSPFPRPSFLESYRGIYVRFEENEEDVVAFIRERMGSGA